MIARRSSGHFISKGLREHSNQLQDPLGPCRPSPECPGHHFDTLRVYHPPKIYAGNCKLFRECLRYADAIFGSEAIVSLRSCTCPFFRGILLSISSCQNDVSYFFLCSCSSGPLQNLFCISFLGKGMPCSLRSRKELQAASNSNHDPMVHSGPDCGPSSCLGKECQQGRCPTKRVFEFMLIAVTDPLFSSSTNTLAGSYSPKGFFNRSPQLQLPNLFVSK